MRESCLYVAASIALGMISYFGSEAFFWVFVPEGAGVGEVAGTVLAYGLASACVLSAVSLTGAGGFVGLFLGAALLGFLVEGVIVSTMYDAFPFQLVWTPLAWHALITGAAVLGMHRVMVHRSLSLQVAAMVALGLFGAFMGSYWPLERTELPGRVAIGVYLTGTGVLAVLGQIALDRVGSVPQPPKWVFWVVPAFAVVLWGVQSTIDPRPQRLALPLMVGLTLWAMRRLGGSRPVSFGPPAPVARHALFLIAPLVTALIAAFGVLGSSGYGSNVIIAATTVPLGLGIWLWYLWRAAWR